MVTLVLSSGFGYLKGQIQRLQHCKNPVGITYSTPGTYDVTLTVTTSTGGQQSVTMPDFITITDPFTGTATSINEGFEGLVLETLPNGWRYSGGVAWGAQESRCLW